MTRYHDGIMNVSYTYYPDNMRKSKKVGNETTTHIWLDDEIALDMTDGNVVNYIHGLNLIVSDYGWYHYNAHGDVVQLSDDNGVVTRDYDPSIGRFISEDPALDGLNWYAYCNNDPVNNIDPSGESWSKVWQFSWEKGLYRKWKFTKQKFSSKGRTLLKDYEAPPKSSYVKDKNNKVIGYKPYNVGDGGLTYGYGSFVPSGDPDKKYANTVSKYMTSGYISTSNAEKLLTWEVGKCEKAINNFIKTAKNSKGKNRHIYLSQQEFDALVIERYLNGHLNSEVLRLLKKKNRKRSDWMDALMYKKTNPTYVNGWRIRAKNVCNVFFDANYERIYK